MSSCVSTGWTHTGSRLTTRVDHPSLGYALKPHQQQALGNLMRVRAMVAQQGERLQQERVNEFLSAAAGGDVLKLQLVSDPPLRLGHPSLHPPC